MKLHFQEQLAQKNEFPNNLGGIPITTNSIAVPIKSSSIYGAQMISDAHNTKVNQG